MSDPTQAAELAAHRMIQVHLALAVVARTLHHEAVPAWSPGCPGEALLYLYDRLSRDRACHLQAGHREVVVALAARHQACDLDLRGDRFDGDHQDPLAYAPNDRLTQHCVPGVHRIDLPSIHFLYRDARTDHPYVAAAPSTTQ